MLTGGRAALMGRPGTAKRAGLTGLILVAGIGCHLLGPSLPLGALPNGGERYPLWTTDHPGGACGRRGFPSGNAAKVLHPGALPGKQQHGDHVDANGPEAVGPGG